MKFLSLLCGLRDSGIHEAFSRLGKDRYTFGLLMESFPWQTDIKTQCCRWMLTLDAGRTYPEDPSVLQASQPVGQHPHVWPESMEGAGLIPAIRWPLKLPFCFEYVEQQPGSQQLVYLISFSMDLPGDWETFPKNGIFPDHHLYVSFTNVYRQVACLSEQCCSQNGHWTRAVISEQHMCYTLV